MICTDPIGATPVTAPKTFTNWARALSFTAARSFRPTRRGEIVEIIRQAEANGQRVKWTGSAWSFMGVFVSNDVIIESDAISGAIDTALILDHLPLADSASRASLAHIKGGTKVFNVNRLLHGLPAAANGGGSDEANLEVGASSRALPTLGGSGGQSIAGVMATGSHGGDVALPPIADAVMAIHLIGPGGQEWWIERSSGFTSGTAAEVQARLRAITGSVPGAAAELCSGVLVEKDDALFRAALVSVGRMGFVYSLVVKTVPGFKLEETRSDAVWETLAPSLTATGFTGFLDNARFLTILINPFPNDGQHSCKVTKRVEVPRGTANVAMEAGGFDIMALICQTRDVRVFIPILLAAIAVLAAAAAGLVALATALFAAGGAVSAIPFVGWLAAAALFTAGAVLVAAAAAIGVTVAALSALVTYLTFAGSMTSGQLIASVANVAYRFGLGSLMETLLTTLFNGAYPLVTKIGVGWKIMDTYGYGGEDLCQKVDSMEVAFDVAAAAGADSGYLAFVNEVLAIVADLHQRNVAVAGLLSLRYTSGTTALIGMSKFQTTCHIEIPVLRNFAGNAELLERVQRAAIAHGGVPHWGQLMATYGAPDIRNLHGDDLMTWRRQLGRLIRAGGGQNATFSNSFTSTYNLEPLDETPVAAVRFTITVGDDSLGDTDIFRGDVSADTVRVVLGNGSAVEISLNEGTTWPAGTTHTRDVPVPAGTVWDDIRSVLIHHAAAGGDINADNWTMNHIDIASVSTGGSVQSRFSLDGAPIWQFRKNDHQVWQHDFF